MKPEDVRGRLGKTIREAIDYEAVAEWICCDPPNPGHSLCLTGYLVKDMVGALLDDDDAEWPSKVLTKVIAEVEAVLAEHERHTRAKVADETRALARQWAANAQATSTVTERERRYAVANALTEHADKIARGEAP